MTIKRRSHRRKRHGRTPHAKKDSGFDEVAAAQWAMESAENQLHVGRSVWEEPLPQPSYSKGWEYQTRVDRLRDVIPFWRDGVCAALEGREVPKTEELFNRVYSEDVWGISAGDWGIKAADVWDTPAGDGWDDGGWKNDDAWNKDSGWEGTARKDTGSREGDINNGWRNEDSGWGVGAKATYSGWEDNIEHQADAPPPPTGWETGHGDGKPDSDKTANMQSEDVPNSLDDPDPNSFVDQVARLNHASGQKKEEMRRFYSVCGAYI